MNYFKVLELQPGASDKEIKSAYYRLVKIHHPDTGGDPEMMKKINAAYEFLKNPANRKFHEEKLRQSKQDPFTNHSSSKKSRTERASSNRSYSSHDNPKGNFNEPTNNEEKESPSMSNSTEKKNTTIRPSYVSGFVIILASVSIVISCWTAMKSAQEKPTDTVIEYKQEPQSQAMIDEIARLKNEISQLSAQVTQLNAQVQQNSLDQAEKSVPSSNNQEIKVKAIELGSTQAEVREVMGTPDAIQDYNFFSQWNYKYSTITFDQNGKVEGWNDISGILKLK